MPRRPIDLAANPLLDIVSYASRGPGRRDHLSPAEIELIARTVNRTPEVMVKVLTRGGQNLGAVRRHLEYLDRKGELEIETDDGQKLSGKGVERELLEDWDLDIEEDRRGANLEARPGRSPPKLVHKVLFSIPPGTPPKKVLEAVKNFAREEFGLKHRYIMVLHTDEPHPHVHMVVKAISEQGERLNVRKATLRQWRADFARHLRALGVQANATQRYVRGETRTQKSDGIYRASLRAQSSHMRDLTQTVARELASGGVLVESVKEQMLRTRREVRHAWSMVSEILVRQRQPDLAQQVRQFSDRMSPPMTEKEAIAAHLLRRAQERAQQTRDPRGR